MNASFDLNHAKLAADPRFAGIAHELSALSPINSGDSFNRYCREACRLWNEGFPNGIGETEQFAELLYRIEHANDGVIRTGWGGVVITLHEHPRVEKYLVVRKGGYLALEMHEQKDERLEIREGAGLVLWRPPNEQSLTVEVVQPGAQFHFQPGMEHCIIGAEDLLVFERSIDPKGMDQDLIFIYEPVALSGPKSCRLSFTPSARSCGIACLRVNTRAVRHSTSPRIWRRSVFLPRSYRASGATHSATRFWKWLVTNG